MLNERELLPLWAHIPPHITLVTLIATRPPLLIRLALTTLGTYQFYALLSRYTTGGGPMHDYSMGGAIHQYLVALYLFVWLCDPLKEWRYKGEKAAPAKYPLLRRLYYAACIVCNARLIGWSSQVANVPPPTATGSRAEYLWNRFLRLLQCLLYLDLAQSYIRLQPLYPLLGTGEFPTGWRGFVMRFVCVFAWYLSAYASMKLVHIVLSLFCVGTGLFNGKPEEWPMAFGNWSDAYTIRRFWGRTWHQNLRRNFTIAGKALTNALGLKMGTNASAYTQLYVAFAISGFIHVGGDVMLGRQYIGQSMPFFLANAVAITVEDAVIAVGRRWLRFTPQPTKWAMLLGYVWVIAWFYLVAPLHVDMMVRLPGALQEEILPFSAVRTYAPPFVTKIMRATL